MGVSMDAQPGANTRNSGFRSSLRADRAMLQDAGAPVSSQACATWLCTATAALSTQKSCSSKAEKLIGEIH